MGTTAGRLDPQGQYDGQLHQEYLHQTLLNSDNRFFKLQQKY